jgi:Tfp pilus assembly protein PilZ
VLHPAGASESIALEISLGGMRLLADGTWRVGDRVVVTFPLADRWSELTLAADVRWIATLGAALVAGIEFARASDDAKRRLAALVNRRSLSR